MIECREFKLDRSHMSKNTSLMYLRRIINTLKHERYINRFHFMFHKELDLRLYSDNWEDNYDKILHLISTHFLVLEVISDYKPTSDNESGKLTDEILCWISELILKMMYLSDDDSIYNHKEDILLTVSRISHFLYNQAGYDNLEEASELFYIGFSQARIGVVLNPHKIDDYILLMKYTTKYGLSCLYRTYLFKIVRIFKRKLW